MKLITNDNWNDFEGDIITMAMLLKEQTSSGD